MADWDDGYVTDVIYTRHAHREMTPAWLAITSLLLGHRPPDLSQPFRYADLGCGHGLTATIVAATCPHAEVWAFDFNPAHVESGRRLASSAGLTNLHFQEASFADLAALPPAGLPEFDFIACHGVVSWISAENRSNLMAIIGRRLRPGGLAYLSYNVATGWASLVPMRTLMRSLMLSSQGRSDQVAAGVLDYLDILKKSGARFFGANPTVEPRLAEIRKQDPRYIAHEFLNADWQPLMFAEMAAAMEGAKCTYIGSATLTDNIDPVSVPQTMMSLVAEASNPVLRETLRDFGVAQTFRRDVYRRGVLPMAAPEQGRLLEAVELVWTGRQVDDPIALATPLGQVIGLPEIYGPLMEMLIAGNHTIGAIRQAPAFATRAVGDVLQAVSLLISGGYVHPALPEAVRASARASTDRLNAAIGAFNADGGDMARLAAATIGSEIAADPLETLVVREKLSGRPMEIEGLTDRVLAALTQAGRSVQRDGKPVTDMGQARAIMREALVGVLERKVPIWRRLGVV